MSSWNQLLDEIARVGFAVTPAPGLSVPREALRRSVFSIGEALRLWRIDSGGRDVISPPGGAWSGTGFGDPRWIELQQEVMRSEAYLALQGAVCDAFGPEAESAGDVLRVAYPGDDDHVTAPHQEAAYVSEPASVVVVWMSLTPGTLARAPLAVVPGSHGLGLLPHTDRVHGYPARPVGSELRWYPLVPPADHVILMSAFTEHRSLPNRETRRPRVSLDLRVRTRHHRSHTDEAPEPDEGEPAR